MWTRKQCEILAFNENLVRKYFSNFAAYNRTENTYYTGWIREAGYRNEYKIRLNLHASFPDEEPSLYVESPRILQMKKGGTINSLDTSHAWHNYSNGPDNPVKICYTNDWDSSCTCVLVIHRAWLWVAAFEVHLISGESIATIIDRWKKKLGD